MDLTGQQFLDPDYDNDPDYCTITMGNDGTHVPNVVSHGISDAKNPYMHIGSRNI